MSSPWQTGRLVSLVPRTNRILSVMVDAALPIHRAGQHLDVQLSAPDGYTARRSYSIASAPGDRPFELLIERLDDGEVSPYFHDVAAPDDTVEVRGPLGGHFVWEPRDGGPLLLIGGGSGIAPLLSMLASRSASAASIPTLLIYSARTWDDLVDPQRLLDLEANDVALTVLLVTTRAPRHRESDLDRRVDVVSIRDVLQRWAHSPASVYVCGSNGFVETVATALVVVGIEPSRIRTERYGADGSVARAA